MPTSPKQQGEWNFPIKDGIDFTATLTWKPDGTDLKDLTNHTAKMQFRDSADDEGAAPLELTDGNGLALGGVAGTIVITITKAQSIFGTRALEYDLVISNNDSPTVDVVLVGGVAQSSYPVTKS